MTPDWRSVPPGSGTHNNHNHTRMTSILNRTRSNSARTDRDRMYAGLLGQSPSQMPRPRDMDEKKTIPTHRRRKASNDRSSWYADDDDTSEPWTLPPQRLSILNTVLVGCILTLAFIVYYYGWTSPSFWLKFRLSPAERILSEHPLIDGHNDLLIWMRMVYGNEIYSSNFMDLFENGGLGGHFDLPRASRGHIGGAFWSAFVPCPDDPLDFSDAVYAPYVRATLDQIDLYKRLSTLYPETFTPPRTGREAEYQFHADGKLISPLAIEGLHQIGNSLSTLRLYHDLGVRYATLNWNCHTRYSDAAVVHNARATPYWGGVSPAGQDLILEMNRMGMIVDLSHVSVDTMRDVLGGSADTKNWTGSIAPPIFSHSSAYALCPHPRNVPDDILQLVKKRNSVVMVNFAPEFISCKVDHNATNGMPEYVDETNTIDQVVDHILHIGNLIGFDHVGLGSDFNGIPTTPRGLEGVDKYPDLIELLLKKGVTKKDVAKVAGGNVLRVWKEVDRVAKRLQKTMDPVEDQLENPWLTKLRVGEERVRDEI